MSRTKKRTQSRTASTRVTRKPDSTAGKRLPKPKTAWELLERVCAHIKAEPATYDQDRWFCVSKEAQQAQMGRTTPCGTMACRAGWVVALNDGHARAAQIDDIRKRATDILGFDHHSGDIWDLFNQGIGEREGTREYVREGVRGLREFMRKYSAHLKARSLKGV